MKSIKFAAVFAASAFLGTTAFAADEQSFSAMQGVEAQAMSSSEMNDVYGQLSIADIDAAIMAKVTDTALAECLVAQVNRLAAMYPAATTAFLSYLHMRYGI